MRLPIVPVAILPDESHVGDEGLSSGVAVVVQLLADTAQVHRLLDHLVVVKDVVLRCVHRLGEPE